MRFVLLHSLLILLMSWAAVVPAAATTQLDGTALWQWTNYEAEKDGAELADASSFLQQYSVFWQKEEEFFGGRAGGYYLGLGYEWSGFDTELNGKSFDLNTSKLFYTGDLLLAPGGLPFRLNAYMRDNHRTTFSRSSIGTRLHPMIVGDVINGKRVETGVTLMVGIRNGSYLGRYRDVLSQFPRLFVDFSQYTVDNGKALRKQHYRTRNLAFVSLNKKDNWFHFRMNDFVDYLRPKNNRLRKQYMLGTIDHHLSRHWINFTNWIQLSADASYTIFEDVVLRKVPTELYDVHLFSKARRAGWQGSLMSTYQRRRDADKLQKRITIPLLVSGNLNRQTAWRFNFEGTRDQRDFYDGREDFDHILFARSRLDAWRARRYPLAVTVLGEATTSELGEGTAVQAQLQSFSRRDLLSRYRIAGDVQVGMFSGRPINGTSFTQWEASISGSVTTNLTPSLQSRLKQRFSVATGSMNRRLFQRLNPVTGTLVANRTRLEDREGRLFQSTTSWENQYQRSRLYGRLNIALDFRSINSPKGEEKVDTQLMVLQSLEYRRRFYSLKTSNQLILGAHDAASGTSGGVGENAADSDKSFSNFSALTLSSSQYWSGAANGRFQWREDKDGSSWTWSFSQNVTRSFYAVNGIVRRFAQVRQEVEYGEGGGETVPSSRNIRAILSGVIYPLSYLQVGGEAEYRKEFNTEIDSLEGSLYVGAFFEKLTVRLEYDHAVTGDINENSWELTVQKTL